MALWVASMATSPLPALSWNGHLGGLPALSYSAPVTSVMNRRDHNHTSHQDPTSLKQRLTNKITFAR
ncbi:hypothetical protein SNOG_14498 [Parastagonospora nodorum SN15]|uniref:Uncharacterized protein n=1 Tax=Phaeosphaeria nodorum (strain SN15 / ATCC MYA-4574 / FGSC 10173) TaxID=321614 RepID=Q0U0Y8_PHANO|nr:hypothetical protein SNOG_14498 [Parastagonospora nodorum SN15]EAT78038.1 hypothetical protein SNOG_14498 [Parastagonospora nodorum SN15]